MRATKKHQGGERMLKIIGMPKDELLGLCPDTLKRPGSIRLLTEEEVIYIAETVGAFWKYNYEAAKQGRVGLHAELKSLLHSDGFFISRILLQHPNIRTIMADQMVMRFSQLGIPNPRRVGGIPDGATELGKEIAELLGAKNVEMKKEDGKIVLVDSIAVDEDLLLGEDFCTRETGFIEAVLDILSKQPTVKILPYELVIINRGGLSEIEIPAEKVGSSRIVVKIVPVVNYRVNDWQPADCPLCRMGSKPIKPKATDENWRFITTSQQ